MKPKLAISYYGEDWKSVTLSNLNPSPFSLNGIRTVCVEGIVQYMNFPDGHSTANTVLGLRGPECKSYMMNAMELPDSEKWAYWNGEKIQRMSGEHIDLLRMAIREKYKVNKIAWEAARLSDGFRLEYSAGRYDEMFSVPGDVFIDEIRAIVQDIRDGKIPCPDHQEKTQSVQ